MKTNLKEKILNRSSELFADFGFFGTSMGAIAKSLNVTKAALYYHFKSKKQLYLEVLNRAFQKLSKAIQTKQGLNQLIKNYLKWGIEEQALIKAQITSFSHPYQDIKKIVNALRNKIQTQFEIILIKMTNKKVDIEVATSFLLAIMDRTILEAALMDKKIDVEKKTSEILKMLKPMIKHSARK